MYNKMKTHFIFMILLLFCFTACSNKEGDAPDRKQDEPLQNEETGQNADYPVLYFAVPDFVNIDDLAVKEINEYLKTEGLKTGLQFIGVSGEDNVYAENIKKTEKEKNIRFSLVSTGLWYDAFAAEDFVRSGYLLDLKNAFETGYGKEVKNLFTEQEWESAEFPEGIFTIPSLYYNPGNNKCQLYYNSGTWIPEGYADYSFVMELLEKISEEDNNSIIIMDADILSLAGYADTSILPFDVQRKEFIDTGSDERCLELKKMIHLLHEKKKLFRSDDSDVPDEFDYYIGKRDLSSRFSESIPVGPQMTIKNHKVMCSIGITASVEDTDEIMHILSLLYKETDFSDLICYGIIEKDYQKENGKVKTGQELNMRAYILGLTAFISPISSEKTGNRRKQQLLDYNEKADFCMVSFVPELTGEQRKLFLDYKQGVTSWLVDNYETEAFRYDGIESVIQLLNEQYGKVKGS